MDKILISACLMGQNVRYDGRHSLIDHSLFRKWNNEGRFVILCPEVAGGLPIPRPPCEQDQNTGLVKTQAGEDMTFAFEAGANHALEIVKQQKIRFALLKERSPSCGVNEIYDGSFSGRKIAGQGRTAGLLRLNGVQVFCEMQLDDLHHALNQI
jgi:uncharacterized protein YbbK (DUF523 family)